MAFGPRQDKARAARPVCFVPAIGYEGRVNAPSLHIEDAAPDRRGRSLLDADPGPSVLVVLLLAILAVRIIALAVSHAELFFDEAQYWFWSRELAFGYYSKPPLIGWIIRGATEICGHGEACIRAPSPLFHAATAMLVYAIGHALYDARIGFWAGLTYATLPGVSLSSSLISTDAPLLFFVALGVLALARMRHDGSWLWALALGAAIGFGLLAKYAMSYFLLGLAI
jgi:4-amino-4-deoxy-L-arabinose transferase-like glycosyltransferase